MDNDTIHSLILQDDREHRLELTIKGKEAWLGFPAMVVDATGIASCFIDNDALRSLCAEIKAGVELGEGKVLYQQEGGKKLWLNYSHQVYGVRFQFVWCEKATISDEVRRGLPLRIGLNQLSSLDGLLKASIDSHKWLDVPSFGL